MTPEAQRIAIAEACPGIICKAGQLWVYKKDGLIKFCIENDPLQDLNAMHETEKVLNPPPIDREQDREDDDPKWVAYCYALAMICPMGIRIRATAAQRAEAFLRTLGLWKE